MPLLPQQPLEMSDFSGGITENILQGDPRRYQSADNMYITVDKKLQERPGFVPFSSTGYNIPSAPGQRINGYFAVINESILLANAARNFYYQNTSGVWTRIVGVNGGEALTAGDLNSQTTISEFQRQVYVASDGALGSNGVLPTKLYRDTTNTWVAKTAGLPRSYTSPNFINSSLLSLCINNANALQTSMIAHMEDSATVQATITTGNVANGKLHANWDVFALGYITNPGFTAGFAFGNGIIMPNPLPTPAPAATDQASLFVLIQALNTAYGLHINDAMKNAMSYVPNDGANTICNFHQNFPMPPLSVSVVSGVFTKGPGAALANSGTPTTLSGAAAQLDDLWQKWNWHRLAVNMHDQENQVSVMNRYAPVGAKIGNIYLSPGAPTITPNWQDFFNYVNNLKALYNFHVYAMPNTMSGAIGAHKQATNYIYNLGLQCSLPDCTDLDSAYLLIYWLRALYQMHYNDANSPAFQQVQYTSVAGSANLTAMTFVTGGGATTAALLNQFIYPITVAAWNGAQDTAGNYKTAKITAAAGGTATLDRVVTNSGTFTAQVSFSQYHQSQTSANNGTQVDSTVAIEQSTDILANSYLSVGVDIPTWQILANDLFFTMANHISYGSVHLAGASLSTFQLILPRLPNLNFFIPSYAAVSYAVFFSDSYQVEPNGIQYLVQGNPVVSASTQVPISYPIGSLPTNLFPTVYTSLMTTAQYGTLLTNLPVLVNDATTQYAASNIKLNIYRTTNGGSTFYLLAQLVNGTTSYLDIINDSLPNPGGTALTSGQPIYTTGGVVASDQPPIAKYTHILNGTAYWGAITDTGQFFPNRIRQSVQFAPDNAPATFSDDLDDSLVGLSSTHNNLIAFCNNSIYRMAGGFNQQGQGSLTHQNISDTLGCLNAKSIVRTEVGIFFAGFDGFYYTDGFQIINITLELKRTYAALTASASQKRSIYGAYDKATRRVHWAMKTSSNDSDNSVVYTFYLDFGIKPSGTFTLMQNGYNFRPSSLVFMAGTMYYAHEKGYLLKSDPNAKFDAIVNSGAPSTWANGVIPYNWTSVAVDMGTTYQRKWMTKFHLVGENVGNVGVQPNVIKDMAQYTNKPVPFTPINYAVNIRWNTPTIVWGDATQIWNQGSKMDVYRPFPQGSLRCDFMQLQLVPATLPAYASSVGYPFGTNATVSASGKTATIVTPSGYTSIVWPSDVVGYYLTLQTDGYVNQFLITALDVTNKILTLADAGSLLVNGSTPWQIMGLKKEQRLKITSAVLHYGYLGDKNQAYPGAASTAGAGNGGANPS